MTEAPKSVSYLGMKTPGDMSISEEAYCIPSLPLKRKIQLGQFNQYSNLIHQQSINTTINTTIRSTIRSKEKNKDEDKTMDERLEQEE